MNLFLSGKEGFCFFTANYIPILNDYGGVRMNLHDVLHGFEITRVRESKELNGTLWEMRHQKTGALLAWMDNGEENKLFSIAFKTLPWDDTGVFHILEHSVLCGSDNYPVKEPFLDLLKGSMNTFLNAMTFADKTMYPVSSRNEGDFMNLTRVYLDAVFRPAIYRNPNIFRQEGWHYELRSEQDTPIFKGVVFNEMKGAFANVNRLVDMEACRALFPNNCYQYVSGGDPEKIPDLSYEDFLSAHRKFYHPTNAKIYLDGEVPLDSVLELIDRDYLSGYEESDAVPDIPEQKPVPAGQTVKYYEIGKDEDDKEKAHMALAKIIGSWKDRKRSLAFYLISDYLTDTNESPLKKAILQSGLAQDVTLDMDDSVAQPYAILHIRNTEYGRRDEIKRVIRETAEDLLKRGLNREDLAAALNQLAFRLKENQEPSGLVRNINALNSWLHGGDPMEYIECEKVLGELRQEMDTDYYENLLRDMLLDNGHTAEIYLLPSRTLGDEKAAAESARLRKANESWNREKRLEIIAQNASLDAWQSAPDSKEAAATVPVLKLSQVSPDPVWTDTQESLENGTPLLFHPVSSNGIVYCRLYFSLADQAIDQLPRLSFLSSLLSQLPTKGYTVNELQREIKKNIGQMEFGVTSVSIPGRPEICRPFFVLSMSVLKENLEKGVSLAAEILKNTVFDDEALIRDLLNQSAEGMYRRLLSAGNGFAVSRVLSRFSAGSAIQEKYEGYDYYRYLTDFKENFASDVSAFQAFARNAAETLFTSDRLIISETADEKHEGLSAIGPMLGGAGENKALTADLRMMPACDAAKEAIRIPAGVSFAAFGGNLAFYQQPRTGALKVLSSLLSYGYLWSEVRVKGGAYGVAFQVFDAGSVTFYSYRDPSPAHSLQVFKETADFIRAFCESDEALEKYVISSIAAGEPLMTPRQQGTAADRSFLSGFTYEDEKKLRDEMLALTKEQLLSLCPLFEKMRDGNAECIVGGDNALKALDDQWTVYSL